MTYPITSAAYHALVAHIETKYQRDCAEWGADSRAAYLVSRIDQSHAWGNFIQIDDTADGLYVFDYTEMSADWRSTNGFAMI